MMASKYLKCFGAAIALLFIIVPKLQAQELPKDVYVATTIPDSLKENANSVVRYKMEEHEVRGPGKEIIKYHAIVTILNEKADDEAVMDLPYNKKYDSYSSIEMKIYDVTGKLIKKYHKSDMYDGSATSGGDLVTDERFMAVRHTIAAYPVTVEIEYEFDRSSFLDLGSWAIQKNEQRIQYTAFHLTIDSAIGFRYRNSNTTIKPKKNSINGKIDYLWEVRDLKAVKKEEGAAGWRVFPKISFATNKFNFFGYPGDFSSWKTYGDWQKALNADVCSLTPEREAEIRKMTDSIKTDKEKAKFLYKYMQRNMRYVSVQLGIGGFKPFAATFVDQKKYGDCKALSNYMGALLKAVGIPSCFAIINADVNGEPADTSFPYDSFNHVILCVPFKADTTWLECTVTTQPFGKLDPYTENRRALIITEDGGKLVNTPRSTMQDNQFNSEVNITLDADGGAKAKVKIFGTGGYRDEYIGISALKMDEQKQAFMSLLKIKQPSSFDLNSPTDENGVREEDLNLEYDKFCDIISGDKQFYRPHVFELMAFTVPIEDKRQSDYYFDHPLQKTCVTTLDLPTGFEIETLPVNQTLKFTYGDYDIKYVYNAAKNQVVSTAKFELTNHVIPAAKYTELQQYLDAVAKAQNKKLVIRRKA